MARARATLPAASLSLSLSLTLGFLPICRTFVIGARGFEPPTARPPAGCATRLRYAPFAGQYSPRSARARDPGASAARRRAWPSLRLARSWPAACAELAEDLRELAWIAGDQAERANVGRGGRLLAELRGEALADARALEALALGVADAPEAPGRCASRAPAGPSSRTRSAAGRPSWPVRSWPRPGSRRRSATRAARRPGRPTGA